MSTGLRYN